MSLGTQNYIRVPKKEYVRLKRLQKHFESFFDYFEHLQDIKKAREETKTKKTIPQERLFKELGL